MYKQLIALFILIHFSSGIELNQLYYKSLSVEPNSVATIFLPDNVHTIQYNFTCSKTFNTYMLTFDNYKYRELNDGDYKFSNSLYNCENVTNCFGSIVVSDVKLVMVIENLNLVDIDIIFNGIGNLHYSKSESLSQSSFFVIVFVTVVTVVCIVIVLNIVYGCHNHGGIRHNCCALTKLIMQGLHEIYNYVSAWLRKVFGICFEFRDFMRQRNQVDEDRDVV
jgi:hypothetical protein